MLYSFFGIAFSLNIQVAYVAAILGGIANSFLDTCVIPSCIEILQPKTGLATMLKKLFISASQLILPVTISIFTLNNIPYSSFMIVCSIILIVIGILVFKIKLPKMAQQSKEGSKNTSLIQNIKNTRFTKGSIALIAIGFTCIETFQLWLNCTQKLASDVVKTSDAGKIQVWYSIGTIVAIILTSILVNKIKSVRFLFVYPLSSLITLTMVLLFMSETDCLTGSFVIGYSEVGGVLQLTTATVNDLFSKNQRYNYKYNNDSF